MVKRKTATMTSNKLKKKSMVYLQGIRNTKTQEMRQAFACFLMEIKNASVFSFPRPFLSASVLFLVEVSEPAALAQQCSGAGCQTNL